MTNTITQPCPHCGALACRSHCAACGSAECAHPAPAPLPAPSGDEQFDAHLLALHQAQLADRALHVAKWDSLHYHGERVESGYDARLRAAFAAAAAAQAKAERHCAWCGEVGATEGCDVCCPSTPECAASAALVRLGVALGLPCDAKQQEPWLVGRDLWVVERKGARLQLEVEGGRRQTFKARKDGTFNVALIEARVRRHEAAKA